MICNPIICNPISDYAYHTNQHAYLMAGHSITFVVGSQVKVFYQNVKDFKTRLLEAKENENGGQS